MEDRKNANYFLTHQQSDQNVPNFITMKKTGSIKYPLDGKNPLLGKVSQEFWQQQILSQNKWRGSLHEKLAYFAVMEHVSNFGPISEFEILIDKTHFNCFDEQRLKRRFDIYVPKLKFGYEVKSYRVGLRKFIRNQIKKDNWLLKARKVKEIRWLLFEGATIHLKKELTANGIVYIDA